MIGNISPVRLSNALKDIYAAAVNPSGKIELPRALANAFDASSCFMHVRSRESSRVAVIGRTENLDGVLPNYIVDQYSSDAWSEIAAAKRLGIACLGDDLVPEDDLVNAEWYNELCRPSEIHHIVGAVFEIAPGRNGLIGIHRAAKSVKFENTDRTMMQLLIPHLVQAYRLFEVADANARARQLTFDSLASLSVGVFIVSCDGRVRMMNGVAERVARARNGLRLAQGRPHLCDPKLDDRLRGAIYKASLAPLGRSAFPGETIIARTLEGSPLLVRIVPLPPDAALSGPFEPLAAIFISEQSSDAEPSAEAVRALYGLTAAETHVLLAVLRGERISDYAEKAGVSSNTVNAQLKSIFGKTGCHRQADLVRKIMSDPMLRLEKDVY